MKKYSVNYNYRKELIYHFKDKGEIIEFKKNALVEFESQKLDFIYLILNGAVKQFFSDMNGTEKVILILSKGDMFGEITMIQRDFDQVTTKTYSPTLLCKINRDTFYAYLNENPDVYSSVLLMITTKFRILMSQIYDNTFFTTKDKLTSLLNRLSKQYGSPHKYGIEICLVLTHEELASMIGSTRSTITKLLNNLEKTGIIRRIGRKIIVTNPTEYAD